MSLLANKRRKRPEMNLVPLIDVLVMLIFFAFVTMQFKSAATLNITLPKVETAGKNEFKGTVTIGIDKDGTVCAVTYSGKDYTAQWLGSRVIQALEAHAYTIVNKTFEDTVGIERERIEDDQYGVYSPVIEQLGWDSKTHPDQLIFGMMKAAVSNQ